MEARKTQEDLRLLEARERKIPWRQWGPYLSERQWGTVREDYSASGDAWNAFPHEHARSRSYRWGEDGLLGISDNHARLCFALALWNEADPILKERLFGLTGPEGNHGEDVKETYFYLDSTPTHSYLKGLYRYPQAEYPYARLVDEDAKRTPDDVLIKITVHNRGREPAPLHVLPTLWFRNTWSWGRTGEGYWPRGRIARRDATSLVAQHASLGTFRLAIETPAGHPAPALLFTENESNFQRIWGTPNPSPYV